MVTHRTVSKYFETDCRTNGFILEIIYQTKKNYGAYEINLDEYSDIGTHWIALYALNNVIITL